MKFLADGMLGKLVRWLRILGQDVRYSVRFNDEELINLAKGERRILLTRDFQLYQRSMAGGLKAFYIETEDKAEQLAVLAKRFTFPLKFDFQTSRCPKCDATLRSARKEEVATKVEKNTYENYNEFWCCTNCGQIYWQGAHWNRIWATLRTAEEKLKLS